MIIQSKRVWSAGQFMACQIDIQDNKIMRILPYNQYPCDVDYGNKRILPGFIDIHCHGAYGFDTNMATEDGLKQWLKGITSEGVTSLLPTTITQSKEVLSAALKNVAKVAKENPEGASILGINFEGPYLDMKYKGAQPEQYIVHPSITEFEQYQQDADGLIKIITMATEKDPDFTLTRYCNSKSIVVSIGHSASTFQESQLAIANGAKLMTHVYNGMTPFNHRDNGLVGAALRINDVYGEIICDGNHSTVDALHIFFQAKGRDYGIMISDALMAKGSEPGSKFIFGGNEIEIYPDGSAHLTSSKTLAGSTLHLNRGLQLLVEQALVPLDTAINSCTINPARLLQVDHYLGKIAANYDADIVVLEDNYDVIQTYCKGKAMLA